MGNNPVNGVDPDGGMFNPVYDENGNYLGTTESGFTGEALIMNPDDFIQGMADKVAFSIGTFLSDFIFSSPSIRDAIETHIVNFPLNDGLSLTESVCIQNYNKEYNYSAEIATKNDLTIRRGVTNNGTSIADKYFEPTVENIRNVVLIHEAKGHGIDGIRLATQHYLLYKNQVDHKQFHSTTDNFKGFTMIQFGSFAFREGIDIRDNNVYNNLYNKYGAPWYEEFNKN